MESSSATIAILFWTFQCFISGVIAPESTKEIKLTFEFVDGKFIPVINKDSDPDPGGGLTGSAIAAVFLLLVVMIIFVGNALLIGTIASSLSLKRYNCNLILKKNQLLTKNYRLPFNVLLLQLGVICILECVLNIVSSVIYLLTQPWRFGVWPCYVNSFFMELIPLIYTVMLVTLVIDRYVAVKDPSRYRKTLSSGKHKCYLFLYWLLSLTALSPVAAGLVKSWPFPDRYSCQVLFKSNTFSNETDIYTGKVAQFKCHNSKNDKHFFTIILACLQFYSQMRIFSRQIIFQHLFWSKKRVAVIGKSIVGLHNYLCWSCHWTSPFVNC
jgi:hypothetical protein